MVFFKNKKIRILFLGQIISSHAQSWMGLLDQEPDIFDIRCFTVPNTPYPKDSSFKNIFGNLKKLESPKIPSVVHSKMLEAILFMYKPDIVHTFAAFPTAALYAPVLKRYKNRFKWVLQVRGGPDVYMNRFDPIKRDILKDLFKHCDILIADNEINYSIATELGIESSKKWSYGIVPGAGGVDLLEFSSALKPSLSQKRVIWPKAYEGFESKGLPVLEAIKIAWPKIKGVNFTFTAGNAELNDYLRFLPQEILDHIDVRDRIPRGEMLELMQQSRVVMAPSLLEGIPNSLYESMAAQCVPIYSPLETYKNKFSDKKNVLYARNLYPSEIAEALVTAINDDELADKLATNNISYIQEIANRGEISNNIIKLYKSIARV